MKKIDIRTKHFDNSGDAYDWTQYTEGAKGTILIILNEKTIGIADTWPITVSNHENTELHTIKSDIGTYNYADDANIDKTIISVALTLADELFSNARETPKQEHLKDKKIKYRYLSE